MSNATKQGNKIVTGLVIGSVIGVTISLIDPATRKRTVQKFESIKDASTRFVQSYKENPDEGHKFLPKYSGFLKEKEKTYK